MASLITRLQRRYIVEGDDLAHDAETCIGELMAALRKIAELEGDTENQRFQLTRFQAAQIARAAMLKCANGD